MDGKLVFISLTAANLLSDSSWWEIYDEAFPHTEREPPQVIIRSLEMDVGQAFAARSGGETIAIATTHLRLLRPENSTTLLQDTTQIYSTYDCFSEPWFWGGLPSTERNQSHRNLW